MLSGLSARRPRLARAWGTGGVALVALALTTGDAPARQDQAPRLNFYPALHLRFTAGQARNYFVSQAGVTNVSGIPMTGVTLRQRFPEGFTPRLVGADAQAVFKRPEGFAESLEGGVYTIHLPELRIAERIVLPVELSYQGRPAGATFPGVEAEFTQNGATYTEKGPDQTWDLAKYTRYSGTIREFLKRYAGMDFNVGAAGDDWGFSSLAQSVAGRVPTGVVEIQEEAAGRLRYSLQAGHPGNLRQMLVIRRPYDPARELKANDEVRRFVIDLVQSGAEFSLDADEFSVQKKKVGRWDGWVAETRWRDKVKDRLGEGPSRWFIFADPRSARQFIINISAQGRGAGPGKADVPNPQQEQTLMSELEGIVTSLRLI